MAGFDNDVMYASNVDFRGVEPVSGQVTTNGQLLIGSTASPNIRVGTLGSSDGSITWTTGAGTITGQVTGGSTVGKTITGNSGGALSPTAGNWNIVGTGSLTAVGSGSTLTAQLTGLTNHAVLVGAGTDTITKLAVGTTGQLLVGATGADPAFGSSAEGNFTFTNSTASTPRVFNVRNTDTNAASLSNITSSVVNASAADPFIQVAVEAQSNYAFGIDNSDSDKLKIAFDAASTTPSGGSQLWIMTTVGERTLPFQPAFLAYQSGNVNDVTGTGTVYGLGSGAVLTEVFDQGNDFFVGDGAGNGATYTAPVTGRHHFSGSVALTGCTVNTGITCTISTSNRSFFNTFVRPAAATQVQAQCSVFCDMDVGDLAFITVAGTGEAANTDDLVGASSPAPTYFSGYLEC